MAKKKTTRKKRKATKKVDKRKFPCPFCQSPDTVFETEKKAVPSGMGVEVYEWIQIDCKNCGSRDMKYVLTICDHDWTEVKSMKKDKKRFLCKIYARWLR